MITGAPETARPSAADRPRGVSAPGAMRPRAGTLELRGVRKTYGPVTAVRDVSVDIAAGEFVTLLGSSGSGKTTTLLMIAGFETPSAGDLILDGRRINDLPPHRRDIGMMFQSYSLFPHMTVEQNIAYPLKIRRIAKKEIRDRVAEALELVHLQGFGKRYPAELSGGQQQRIALARATVYRPPLLLMDEPLSALDRRLRSSMQEEIRRIHRDLGTTVVYVTHDQDEALALSDRIVLMHDGEVAQEGTPADIYDRPNSRFTASFIGESIQLPGLMGAPRGAGVSDVTLGDGTVVAARTSAEVAIGRPVVVCVRPEHLSVAVPEPGSAPAGLRLEVHDKAFLGDRVQLAGRFDTGDKGMACIGPRLAERIQIGGTVVISWTADNALVLPGDVAAD